MWILGFKGLPFFWLQQACPLMIFLFCKEMIAGSLKNY